MMDVDKSIENGELSYSDGSLMRPYIYISISLVGFIIYFCCQESFEAIGTRELVAVILFLALLSWAGKNAFLNYSKGNKLLDISTKLSLIENSKIAKKTIERLHWKIELEEQNYYIATNNNDEYNWNDYEATVICLEGKILFNYRGLGKGGSRKALYGPIENEKHRLIFEEEFHRQKNGKNGKKWTRRQSGE